MAINLTPEQIAAIDRLLELLPTFEDPEFVPATWPERSHVDSEGKKHQHMPYPDYHPAVEEFRTRCSAMVAGIHPYEALPEDETPNGVEFNVLGTSFDHEYFAKATVDQIRRYLILLSRGERFCDGHIEGEFLAGKVVAALHRLAILRG